MQHRSHCYKDTWPCSLCHHQVRESYESLHIALSRSLTTVLTEEERSVGGLALRRFRGGKETILRFLFASPRRTDKNALLLSVAKGCATGSEAESSEEF